MITLPTCWLTKAQITKQTIFFQQLRDSYAWHKKVWKAFPTKKENDKRDFLTRLENKFGGVQLLMISTTEPTKPEWLHKMDTWESKIIPTSYFQNGLYDFQLKANPTHRPRVDAEGVFITNEKDRKRRSIFGKENLQSWLKRKGDTGGFKLNEKYGLEIVNSIQSSQKKEQSITHGTVDFKGVIEITDPTVFYTTTFLKGVGSAKAFGTGMFIITPLFKS